MSAAEALAAARTSGIRVELDGDDLVLAAPVPPPTAVLDLMSRHKRHIVALLRPDRDGWSAEDWRMLFEERAGIAEFDGGLPRDQAEAGAFACCVSEWLSRGPFGSPRHCQGCGRGGTSDSPLLRLDEGHAWLHAGCRPVWQARRKAEAVAARA